MPTSPDAVPLHREEACRLPRSGKAGPAAVVRRAQHRPGEGHALVDPGLPVPEDNAVVLVVEVGDGGAWAVPAGEGEPHGRSRRHLAGDVHDRGLRARRRREDQHPGHGPVSLNRQTQFDLRKPESVEVVHGFWTVEETAVRVGSSKRLSVHPDPAQSPLPAGCRPNHTQRTKQSIRKVRFGITHQR